MRALEFARGVSDDKHSAPLPAAAWNGIGLKRVAHKLRIFGAS